VKGRYDSIIVGAGIAGLGVAAILSKEANQKVLVLDRYAKFGGRLTGYADAPKKGWTVDLGLHFIELGEKSSANELNYRVGKKVAWAPFSETVEIWKGKGFVNVAELVPINEQDKQAFRDLLQRIAAMTDPEIEAWDNRSFEEWLRGNAPLPSVKELLTDIGMIMTTIPNTVDMAAGEVLFIARDNLRKVRQVLQASYPLEGMGGLTKGLAEVIKENGGEIRTHCEVEEIVIQSNKALGVRIPSQPHIYEEGYRVLETEAIYADRVICALPIYQLSKIIDFNPETSPMPRWWVKHILDIQDEVTGVIGYVIGLREPIIEPRRRSYLTCLKMKHAQLPFQAFPASNFSPSVAPEGKQLLYTGGVCEHLEASNKFKREKLLSLMWEDIKEMFSGIEEKMEWKVPYYVDGCDGLARKPGLVGNFKPGLRAPGIPNLFFAGDTYVGRGLATNGAARSAMLSADLILKTL
jgi:phytoene dehydrogenase-like protein